MAQKTDKAILVDTSLCIGCKACQLACKEWHNLPAAEFDKVPGTYQNPADRSFNTLTLMRFDEKYDRKNDRFEWLIRKDQCMHCSDAPCVAICPTGALYQHKDGFVAFDQEACIGCGFCAKACPFDIPRYQFDAFTGKEKMNKCNFCQDKVTNGELPACVQVCPTNALELTSWDEAIKEAYKRVEQLKERYPNANVYGDKIMGGTHYIYVLTDSPEQYGLPIHPKTSELVDFRSNVIKPVTEVLLGAVGIGFLANFIVSSATFNHNGKDELHDSSKEEKKNEQ